MTAASRLGDASSAAARRNRFRALYDEVYDDLWRYVQRRSVNETEAHDTLSDVFLVAWRRFDDMPTGDEARPWLFGVARNQLRSGWRRRERNSAIIDRIADELVASPNQGTSLDPVEPTEAASLLEAMKRLRASDQEIIRLVAWEELSHREIATVLGCSENAVAIRLHRARARLTRALERIGGAHHASAAMKREDL